MIISLGDFKFTLKTNINSIERTIDAGVAFQERISNHATAVVCKKWEETISIEGETMPAAGAGQKALVPLESMVKAQKPVKMYNTQKYIGIYIVQSFQEGRQAFRPTGEFLKQSFSLELRRVADD